MLRSFKILVAVMILTGCKYGDCFQLSKNMNSGWAKIETPGQLAYGSRRQPTLNPQLPPRIFYYPTNPTVNNQRTGCSTRTLQRQPRRTNPNLPRYPPASGRNTTTGAYRPNQLVSRSPLKPQVSGSNAQGIQGNPIRPADVRYTDVQKACLDIKRRKEERMNMMRQYMHKRQWNQGGRGSPASSLPQQESSTELQPGIVGTTKVQWENNILRVHNEKRRLIREGKVPGQPAARQMPDLRWNDTLKLDAATWAAKCVFEHFPKPGQGDNLAIASYPNDTPAEGWFDEHKDYTYGPHVSQLPPIGHYTQMIWASTTDVGCAKQACAAIYECDEKSSQPIKLERYNPGYYTVCRYWPPGNILKSLPYERRN